MTDPRRFHDGELAVQALAGERDVAERHRPMLGAAVPPGGVAYLEQQRFLVVGTVDAGGEPWASVLLGPPGFVRANEAGDRIAIEVPEDRRTAVDPMWANLGDDPRVGLLAIDLVRRRRLRANGVVTAGLDGHVLRVAVEQAFGNCPKYIQRRESEEREHVEPNDAVGDDVVVGDAFDGEARAIVARADAMFVASVNGAGGADASHRGGVPGFVERLEDDTLVIPDSPGNGMFNTLGNLHAHPRAGLVFVDFDGGMLLQVAGAATIDFGAVGRDGRADRTGGTGRAWRLHPEAMRRWRVPGLERWRFVEASPFNPAAPVDGPKGDAA